MLAVAILVSAIVVLIFCFSRSEEQTPSADGVLVTTGSNGSGIKLTTAAVSSDSEAAATINATADSICEITATFEPENSMGNILWNVSGTDSSSIEIVDSEGNAVSETQSGESVFAVCVGAFDEQVTVTASAENDSSVYAEIVCDYVARLNSEAEASITIMEDCGEDFWSYKFMEKDGGITIKLHDASLNTYTSTPYDFSVSYSELQTVGTIYDDYSVQYINLKPSAALQSILSASSSIDLFEIYDGNAEYYGIRESLEELTNSGFEDLNYEEWSKLQGLYEGEYPLCTATIVLAGDTYGLEYEFTCEVFVDFTNFYVSPEAVSSNVTNVAF